MSTRDVLYSEWVYRNPAIWTFEHDDAPSNDIASALRETHTTILKALETMPAYLHQNCTIHESAILKGNVVVEEGAQILANTIIDGPAYIGRGAVVGNFSFLRGPCFLSRESLVGNHCYCNESVVGRSARIAHFANFSRSLICYNSSVSAFVITATVKADKTPVVAGQNDYKQASKLGSIIGANTFIAPHVVLSPGVCVGHRCFIGSYVLLTEDVADDTFLKVEHKVSSRPNMIKIPKREKAADYSQTKVGVIDRKYAGVLMIDDKQHFVLQRRDDNERTFNAGKIALFGGSLKKGETPIGCAIRELREETTIMVAEQELTVLADLVITREDQSKTLCSIFVLENANSSEITINEGQRYEILSREQAASSIELTQLCRTAITEYLKL